MSEATQKGLELARVTPEEIARKRDWSQAISLCAELRGYNLDKQAHADIEIDKARWSRIKAGTEGIKWSQLEAFMDKMGNDAPVLWMLHQRGYDLHSIRKRETEYQREIRELQESAAEKDKEIQILQRALRGGGS